MSLCVSDTHLAVSFQKTLHLVKLDDQSVKTFPFEHDIVDAVCTNSYIFAALSNKSLKTLDLDGACVTENDWTLPKQPSVITKTDEDSVVVGDRFGYQILLQVLPDEKKYKKCGGAGHLSLITAQVSTGECVISGDRESAIWINHYPKAWVIQGFCFGHTKYITSLCLHSDNLLLSGGGDGTIRIFNWKTQDLLSTTQIYDGEVERGFSVNTLSVFGDSILATTNHDDKKIHVFTMGSEHQLEKTKELELCQHEITSVVVQNNQVFVLDCQSNLICLDSELNLVENELTNKIQASLSSTKVEPVQYNPIYKICPRHCSKKVPKKRANQSNNSDHPNKKVKTNDEKKKVAKPVADEKQ